MPSPTKLASYLCPVVEEHHLACMDTDYIDISWYVSSFILAWLGPNS